MNLKQFLFAYLDWTYEQTVEKGKKFPTIKAQQFVKYMLNDDGEESRKLCQEWHEDRFNV